MYIANITQLLTASQETTVFLSLSRTKDVVLCLRLTQNIMENVYIYFKLNNSPNSGMIQQSLLRKKCNGNLQLRLKMQEYQQLYHTC